MFPLFETIKITDGKPQYLEWHQQRVNRSYAALFVKRNAPYLENLISVPEQFKRGTVKCRFYYNLATTNTEYAIYSPMKINSLKLIHENTIDYSLKFTDRNKLEELRKQKGNCDEILIVKNGRITDTSFTNIVFFNGTKWETPKSVLLKGTCRQRLLSEGKIAESDITVDDLTSYVSFRLINAMLSFEDAENISIKKIYF